METGNSPGSDLSDEHLLRKLVSDGVEKLTGDELTELAELLEVRAVRTGLAAPVFVSESLRAVVLFMLEHDSAGGVRVEFLKDLDKLFRTLIPNIQQGDPVEATRLAQHLRDEVGRSISHYRSEDTYE